MQSCCKCRQNDDYFDVGHHRFNWSKTTPSQLEPSRTAKGTGIGVAARSVQAEPQRRMQEIQAEPLGSACMQSGLAPRWSQRDNKDVDPGDLELTALVLNRAEPLKRQRGDNVEDLGWEIVRTAIEGEVMTWSNLVVIKFIHFFTPFYTVFESD